MKFRSWNGGFWGCWGGFIALSGAWWCWGFIERGCLVSFCWGLVGSWRSWGWGLVWSWGCGICGINRFLVIVLGLDIDYNILIVGNDLNRAMNLLIWGCGGRYWGLCNFNDLKTDQNVFMGLFIMDDHCSDRRRRNEINSFIDILLNKDQMVFKGLVILCNLQRLKFVEFTDGFLPDQESKNLLQDIILTQENLYTCCVDSLISQDTCCDCGRGLVFGNGLRCSRAWCSDHDGFGNHGLWTDKGNHLTCDEACRRLKNSPASHSEPFVVGIDSINGESGHFSHASVLLCCSCGSQTREMLLIGLG